MGLKLKIYINEGNIRKFHKIRKGFEDWKIEAIITMNYLDFRFFSGEKKKWLIWNCRGKFAYSDPFIIFENKDDAMLFKLVWY